MGVGGFPEPAIEFDLLPQISPLSLHVRMKIQEQHWTILAQIIFLDGCEPVVEIEVNRRFFGVDYKERPARSPAPDPGGFALPRSLGIAYQWQAEQP